MFIIPASNARTDAGRSAVKVVLQTYEKAIVSDLQNFSFATQRVAKRTCFKLAAYSASYLSPLASSFSLL